MNISTNLVNDQMPQDSHHHSSDDLELSFDMVQDASSSPMLNEDSLIFERDVQDDPLLLPFPSSTTLTSNSTINLNNLANGTMGPNLVKTRSNSTLSTSLTRQRTSSESYSNINNANTNANGTPTMCPPIGIIPNRRLSRTNSYTNANLNNGTMNSSNIFSNSMKSNGSFLNASSMLQVSSISPTTNNVTNIIQHHHHNRRRTMENLVAPALDASCYIDNNVNVNDVKIIHSRSSSIIGLDMALGRVRTNSFINSKQSGSLNLDKFSLINGNLKNNDTENDNDNAIDDDDDDDNNTNNTAGTGNYQNQNDNEDDDKNILKFYSYNDLITNEKISNSTTPISMKRPSLVTSYSSSYMKSPPTPLSYINSPTQLNQNSNIKVNTNYSNCNNKLNPQFLNPFGSSRSSSPYTNQSKIRRFSSNNNGNNNNNNNINNNLQTANISVNTNNGNNSYNCNSNNNSNSNCHNESVLNSPITRNGSYMNKLRNNSNSNGNGNSGSNINNILLKKTQFHIESSESEDDNDEYIVNNEIDSNTQNNDNDNNDELISTIPHHNQKKNSLIINNNINSDYTNN